MNKDELLNIINNKSECEYIEFKDSFRDKDEIGEYISALSNGACLRKQEFAYLIWGVNDKTRELTNTKFNYQKEVNGENYSHYLSRNLNPRFDIDFKEELIDDKRIVYLQIPASSDIITDYKGIRYIRVGSSKTTLNKYPKCEKKLWLILNGEEFSLSKEESPRQDLTFRIFRIYLDEYNITYNEDNLFSNNHMLTKEGKFNYIAFMLSDQFDMSLKITKFVGVNKRSDFVYRKEFGNCCVLKTIDDLTEYMEKIENKVRSYFDPGKASRRDEYLFDMDSFREAYINAVLHNDYSSGSGPSVFLFSDHLEVYSHGSPLTVQTKEEFLRGQSIPINPDLARVFMKFENFEESGKGVNTIIRKYGSKVFEFSKDNTSFSVSLPFNVLAENKGELVIDDNTVNTNNNDVRNEIYENVLVNLIKNNNKITQKEMAIAIGKTPKTVERIIKSSNRIKRVGAKRGYWIII